MKSPGAKRLSGRLPVASPALKPLSSITSDTKSMSGDDDDSTSQLDALIGQVTTWIHAERAKRSHRKSAGATQDEEVRHVDKTITTRDFGADAASDKTPSEHASDLDQLEYILKQSLNFGRTHGRKISAHLRRHGPIKRPSRKGSVISSDTDYVDGDVLVPSSDAVLDNSKTLAYTGGASDESDISSGDELTRVTSFRDQDSWSKFKFEIVRLAHTLRLKGWRKVPLDISDGITVQRLSGALTNAVYVVMPPADLPPRHGRSGTSPQPKKPPPKLLLRIYGPQVEHLIDRESELAILRRLARKRIGPRLLGTFANGRFEEYFNAETLTADDLRNPLTSQNIAKRLRELHDGIDLIDEERDAGAFVWANWDKWERRVEQVVLWLDAQIEMLAPGAKPSGHESWKRRGLICGVPWKTFQEAVAKYRKWLNAEYGGASKLRQQLVFSHNDTQYGNILRLVPAGTSPLMLPANTHKQLVVIDFEYANANLPGLEFANHFTEWCYNYHDKRKPYGLVSTNYPTPEEQDRFIRAYVRHRPQFQVSTPKLEPESGLTGTPSDSGMRRNNSSYTDFVLDSRSPYFPPTAAGQATHDDAEKAAEDAEVARLMHETRMWRLANTAQWVAWGIVQAKVPGMPDFSPKQKGESKSTEELAREDLGERAEEYRELAREQGEGAAEPEAEEEEFDYLGYAQHRAMMFWGDAMQLGLVKAEDLPSEIQSKIKTVPY